MMVPSVLSVNEVSIAVILTLVFLVLPVEQVLLGVTATLPEVEPKFTVIELVPEPLAMDAPVGTVHAYAVAPDTEAMLYATPVALTHSLVEPVTDPVAPSAVLQATAVVPKVPLPHELVGVTVILPASVPKVTVMVFVPAPLVIDAPDGTVQS